MSTETKREAYAREIGRSDARSMAICLRWAVDSLTQALELIDDAERMLDDCGYIRRNLLALAIYAVRSLLALLRHDLEKVGGRGDDLVRI